MMDLLRSNVFLCLYAHYTGFLYLSSSLNDGILMTGLVVIELESKRH